jgi:predicted PurR-regulated permease PerM
MFEPETERDRFARVLFYAVVFVIGYLAFRVVGPFLAPLTWAAVFAMVLFPLQTRLRRRLKRPAAAAGLTTVVAALLIVGPAVGVLTIVASEVTTVIQRIQDGTFSLPTSPQIDAWYATVRQRVLFPLPENIGSTLTDSVQAVATYIAGKAGGILQNVANLVFQLFVMLFALFYCLRDGGRMVDAIRTLLPFEPARRDRIISQTHDLVVATVGSTFAVAITQGTLTGLTLSLLGFHATVFWGVMTAFFSLIPAVGSGLIWGPAAIYLFATGDMVRGGILLGVGVGVISMADNVLRPLLLSGRTTMHGLLVFVSLLGGVAAFGFIGLVIGPVIMAAFETLVGAVAPVPATDEATPAAPDARAPGGTGPAAPTDAV